MAGLSISILRNNAPGRPQPAREVAAIETAKPKKTLSRYFTKEKKEGSPSKLPKGPERSEVGAFEDAFCWVLFCQVVSTRPQFKVPLLQISQACLAALVVFFKRAF